MSDSARRFDPFAESYLADPYPLFRELRAATPAFYCAELDHWVVTRHADVREILAAPRIYSAANALSPLHPIGAEAAGILAASDFRPVAALTNNDPPDHTRVRRLANSAFRPKRVAAMESLIRELVREFLDRCRGRSGADLIGELAWQLPLRVVFRVLGIPDDDAARIKSGSDSRIQFIWGRPTPDEQRRLAHSMAEFWRYSEDLVARRTVDPRDDFTSDLASARAGEEAALTRGEVTTIVYGLLTAGHETTTSLIGNAFRRLLDQREAWAEICADPALIPNAVEEVLRFDSPVIAWRRRTRASSEIGGVGVPAGANLLLLLGSANRDPAVFADPERFDIRRANAGEHLSFGHGAHFCLGAPLARLEARVVLEELCASFPEMRLTRGQTLRVPANVAFRGPLSLLVEFGAARESDRRAAD
ncbi:MAG: cytochrome P450 [Myxococcota bacterium]